MNTAINLTRNEQLVLGRLTDAASPLSAYDILDQVRSDGIKAPLQIYRALEKLQEKGLAHRLESLNAFVACDHSHDHRAGLTAFAICDTCGQVDEFSDFIMRQRLEGWEDANGFHAEHTTVEIRGRCATCAHAA